MKKRKIISAFHHAASAVCNRISQNIFVALMAAPLVACVGQSPTAEIKPPPSFVIGGYSESAVTNPQNFVFMDQAKYLKDKAELEITLSECIKQPAAL